MHNIILDRDDIGRLRVVQASASTSLTNPLEGMHSLAREEILFKPLTSAERQLMKASKHLDIYQRRVVAHYIISNRRADYQHKQDHLARQATRMRAEDQIDDENKRQSTHLDFLARQAEKQAAIHRHPVTPQPDTSKTQAPEPHRPDPHHGHRAIDDEQEEEDEMGR
ncbi:hypothetical protein [Hyphomicrobium sp. DY-1]|uniref:hypothetical protein n=1 Tax=Hyphomicrobium sp. DY-1 TaxID=3075650 RepID=UPI0039C4977C